MATDKDPHVIYLQDVVKALDPSLADEIDEGLVIAAREPGGKVRLDDVVNAFRALGRLDEVALVELLSSGQWNIHFPFDVRSTDGMSGGELGIFSELLAEDQSLLNGVSDET